MATDVADPPAAIRSDLPGQDFDPVARPSGAMQLATQRAGVMQTAYRGLIPTSIGEAFILAGYLAKSNSIPKSLRTGSTGGGPESVLTVILAGMELGLSPIKALQSITNISGTLCIKADLQLGIARGILAFYDEGFEEKGRTDSNVGRRVTLGLKRPLLAAGLDEDQVAEQIELVIAKIMAAAQPLPEGKPYGWAMGIRQGQVQAHVRTFTWADAEAAVIYEKDEDNPGAPKERKPLSQKFNYKSFPGDMYPKRARTRVLQILANDVLAGLPAVEQLEGGQIIDAEFTVNHGDGDDVDTLMAAIRDEDAEAATTVEAAFTQLRMGRGAQLQKLTQFKGKPKELVTWLKDEWAGRKGKGRVHPDVLSGEPAGANAAGGSAGAQQPAASSRAADPKSAGGSLSDLAAQATAKAAEAETAARAAGPKPVEREPDPPVAETNQPGPETVQTSAPATPAAQPVKPTPGADLAGKIRKNLKTF